MRTIQIAHPGLASTLLDASRGTPFASATMSGRRWQGRSTPSSLTSHRSASQMTHLSHLDDYVDLLSRETPVEQRSAGLIYSFPNHLEYEHDVTLISSDTPEGDRFLAGLAADRAMPQTLMALGFLAATEIWAPWCIALHHGEVASIGMTARISPAGAEAGVITVPALRGRGFAAAAVAGWASLPSLHLRALFYSADRTNISSQRVAERLGLRFIGASLRLT